MQNKIFLIFPDATVPFRHFVKEKQRVCQNASRRGFFWGLSGFLAHGNSFSANCSPMSCVVLAVASELSD
jgi:hypothetical protein